MTATRSHHHPVQSPSVIVLGTSSQVPTRYRNHNGYLVRWGDEGFLFDPGENTNRQFALADADPTSVTKICVTHFHGDHCLGLAGLFHRLGREGVRHAIDVYFPAYGQVFVERALVACRDSGDADVRLHPFPNEGVVYDDGRFRLSARRLSHSIETFGYRLEELAPDGSATRVLAFVMDTRKCRAAHDLARDADLLIVEATYASSEEKEAWERGHMTAAHAAEVAQRSGVRQLLLTHFSQRYPNTRTHLAEAKKIYANVKAASDLRRYSFPPPRREDDRPVPPGRDCEPP
jgi:ribonuclease Z